MRKKRVSKKSDEDYPKKKTAYSVFQEINSPPSRAQPMSSGKKKITEKSSAKKVKEAVKLGSSSAKGKQNAQPNTTNLFATSFFKMLSPKVDNKPIESISMISGKRPVSDPNKSFEKDDDVPNIKGGNDKKGNRRRSRGRNSDICSQSSPHLSETHKSGLTVADEHSGAETQSSSSKADVIGDGSSKTPIRISPRLRSKGSVTVRESDCNDSNKLSTNTAVGKRRKSLNLEEDSSSPTTKDVDVQSKRTPQSRKRAKKSGSLTIVGHGSMEVDMIKFVKATDTSEEKTDDATTDAMDDSALDAGLEDNNTSIDFSEDGAEMISIENIIQAPDKDKIYIVLDYPQEICLRGKYSIRMLIGNISLLGYNIRTGSPPLEVFSPENSSHLVIKTVSDVTTEKTDVNLKTVIDCKDVLCKVQAVLKKKSAVVLLSKLNCSICDKVAMINPFESLFPKRQNVGLSDVDAMFTNIHVTVADDKTRKCVIGAEYEQIAEVFTATIESGPPPVAMLCGGKNAGKSTLGRYLINTALNSCDAVGYLECDVGQTEFTPPGCVAFNIISKPLLGPPFTHQKKAECMYYIGALSPADNPSFYVECVKKVFSVYHSMVPRIPLIVNTMGWTRGIGIPLLMDTIRIVNPTFLVQLNTSSTYRNYAPLTTEYVSQTPGWRHLDTKHSKDEVDFEYFMVQSPTNLAKDGHEKYKAADHRDLAILAYFTHVLPPRVSLINIHSIQPYKLRWSDVAVHVANVVVPHDQIMYALNATIVALCHADSSLMKQPNDDTGPKSFTKMPICDCIGFGIVRGIDPVEKVFYVITPVPSNELHHVNTIIKGAMTIPNQLINKLKSSGIVPYVDNPQNVHGVKPVARSFLQRRKSPHRAKTN